MDKLVIKGGCKLEGEIKISGAKNSVLPLMAASLLTEGCLNLYNFPELADTATMSNLLLQHGVEFSLNSKTTSADKSVTLCAKNVTNLIAPYEIVKKMRASILVLGPLLARFKQAKVSLPGGCTLGARSVDIHIDGLRQMGAEIEIDEGYIVAKTKGLKGCEITMKLPSVGATENLLMAATLAEGRSILHNVAKEPEIVDLANCLKAMGADIVGAGSDTIIINGKDKLIGATHRVIGDRIEAATYAIGACITRGNLLIKGFDPKHIAAVLDKLEEAGAEITIYEDSVQVDASRNNLKPVNIETGVYPAYPTDAQAQLMALMCTVNGESKIKETIFENRFMHVQELARLGAKISVSGDQATITGVPKLKGSQVMATDLRASVSLVLAGLAAEGVTVLDRLYHLDRGYENLEEKLRRCGAVLERAGAMKAKSIILSRDVPL